MIQVLKIIDTVMLAITSLMTFILLMRIASGHEKANAITTGYFLVGLSSQLLAAGLLWST